MELTASHQRRLPSAKRFDDQATHDPAAMNVVVEQLSQILRLRIADKFAQMLVSGDHNRPLLTLVGCVVNTANLYWNADGFYDSKRHAKVLQQSVLATPPFADVDVSRDALRVFLVECLCLHCIQAEGTSHVDMWGEEAVRAQFGSHPEFTEIPDKDWELYAKFHNYLVVCLRFVDARSNKIKLIAAAAALCGVTTCMQGGNPTSQTKRLHRVFELLSRRQAADGLDGRTQGPVFCLHRSRIQHAVALLQTLGSQPAYSDMFINFRFELLAAGSPAEGCPAPAEHRLPCKKRKLRPAAAIATDATDDDDPAR